MRCANSPRRACASAVSLPVMHGSDTRVQHAMLQQRCCMLHAAWMVMSDAEAPSGDSATQADRRKSRGMATRGLTLLRHPRPSDFTFERCALRRARRKPQSGCVPDGGEGCCADGPHGGVAGQVCMRRGSLTHSPTLLASCGRSASIVRRAAAGSSTQPQARVLAALGVTAQRALPPRHSSFSGDGHAAMQALPARPCMPRCGPGQLPCRRMQAPATGRCFVPHQETLLLRGQTESCSPGCGLQSLAASSRHHERACGSWATPRRRAAPSAMACSR
jgi:hypothetical protein